MDKINPITGAPIKERGKSDLPTSPIENEMERLANQLALSIGKFTWAEKSGLSIKDRWSLITKADMQISSLLFLLSVEKNRALMFMEKEVV